METYRGVESIDYANNREFDFLAYIVSPWHLLGVKAVVQKLKAGTSDIRGLVMICKNHCDKYLITEIPEIEGVEFAYYENGNLSISSIFGILRIWFRRNDIAEKTKSFIIPYKLDVFLYALYSLKNKKKCITECYIIDEGLGTYLGLNIDKLTNTKRVFNITECLSLVKNKISELLRSSLELKLKKQTLIYDFSLLIQDKNNHLRTNESVVDYYRQVISSEAIICQEENNIYDNAVLINTQPLEGVVDNADIDILYNCCKQCYAKGIKVVVKPHPAEKDLNIYSKLDQYVNWDLRNELSQEVILNSLIKKPLAIISFYSTTLVTSKLFWGIPTFSVAKILLSEDISNGLRNKLTDFMNVFNEHTVFCDSIDSLVNTLAEIDI